LDWNLGKSRISNINNAVDVKFKRELDKIEVKPIFMEFNLIHPEK
jgi:hypothetical protein